MCAATDHRRTSNGGAYAPPYRHFADFVGGGDPDDPPAPRPHALRRERCPHPAAVNRRALCYPL